MTKMKLSKEEIIDELEELKYEKPKCDFEHIWNCAIDTTLEIIETGGGE